MKYEVGYVITLEDLMSEKLKTAKGHADHLEHKMDELKEKANGFGENMLKGLETLGVGLAIFEGGKFIHEGVEAFHNMEQANAQLEAGLESTGGRAGMTMKTLNEGAEKFNATTLFNRTQIKEMQSQLLLFPGINKKNFNETSQTIVDIAARTHKSTSEVATGLAKALDNPARGMRALRQYGVKFSKEQTKHLAQMAETGHLAEVQALIMGQLTKNVAGAAQAAFNADPLAQYNKTMEDTKLAVGKAGEEILTTMAPALLGLAGMLKKGVDYLVTFGHWLRDNTAYIKGAAVVVGGLALAWLAVNAGMLISAAGSGILTAALWLLDAAAAANPLGLIIVAISAFVAAIVIAYNKSEKFRQVISGVGGAFKSLMPILHAVGEMIAGVFTFNPALIAKGFSDFKAGLTSIATNFHKGFLEGADKHVSTMDKIVDAKKGAPGALGPEGSSGAMGKSKAKSEHVGGSRVTTINIQIGNLIHDFKVMTTNMTEGSSKIKDLVASALLSAVNDSQVIAT